MTMLKKTIKGLIWAVEKTLLKRKKKRATLPSLKSSPYSILLQDYG
jgi:hypothetical protein